MTLEILSQDWFQLIVIPAILAFLEGGLSALASPDISPSLEHWTVGIDLCLEGWAINFGLAAYKASLVLASLPYAEAATELQNNTRIFLAVTLMQLILLVAATYIVRFFREAQLTRFVAANFLGLAAITVAFYSWG